ncbi:hypothetical protein OB955_00900 [Halobacteria archaeon AArc-m2/3/4]|uniref:Uncharacterized protein n=1 Tax=Natronoglomus mannanivorans TaxID=2979990 RepID=A0AAP2Z0F7_9EURY|nr:hypothetical protein [Halobacteria archaeon AArc-xg1-1]MCU4971297.1 hypothetical protein [Halobacteria archaeon AArc-m2/3/4]
MAEDTEPAHDHDSAADVGHDVDEGRTTAPMSEFTTRDVGIGAVVLAVGLAIAFAIPLLVML